MAFKLIVAFFSITGVLIARWFYWNHSFDRRREPL